MPSSRRWGERWPAAGGEEKGGRPWPRMDGSWMCSWRRRAPATQWMDGFVARKGGYVGSGSTFGAVRVMEGGGGGQRTGR